MDFAARSKALKRSRKIHVAIAIIVVLVVLAVIVVGLTWPVCNASQQHGFYYCKCPANTQLDQQTGLCMCSDTLAELGNQCDSSTQNLRYVWQDVSQNLTPESWSADTS